MIPQSKPSWGLLSLSLAVTMSAPAGAGQAHPTVGRPCPAAFVPEGDLAATFDQAGRDVTACVRSGRLAPRDGRRTLSAIAQLRDLALYDERRGWGTSNERRDRLYDARLRSIMSAALR